MSRSKWLRIAAVLLVLGFAFAACGGGETTESQAGAEIIRFAFAPDPVWDYLKDTGETAKWEEANNLRIVTSETWDEFTFFAGGHGEIVSMGTHELPVLEQETGMKVVAFDPRQDPLISEVLGFAYAPLEELLGQSDVISLHAPLNQHTYHLINRDTLEKVKRGALLINTARGGLVDTDALLWALDEGILAGAGLDVIEGEELIEEEKQLLRAPLAEEKLRMVLRQHVLLRREDVVITPHIAFNSWEAMERIVDTTIANIRYFLAGKPQNVVNPGAGKKPVRRAA